MISIEQVSGPKAMRSQEWALRLLGLPEDEQAEWIEAACMG